MKKSEQYKEIILQTNKWFDKKIEQLQVISDENNDKKILFQGNDGDKVELPEDLKKGFLFGIKMAIEIFGEFPVKISKANDSN